MFLELLGTTVLGIGLTKDKIEQKKPYYGTEKDKWKDNPKVQENRKAVDDIIAKHKAEYIKKNGHSW